MNTTASPSSAPAIQNPVPRRRWLRRTAIAGACLLGLWGVLWLGAPPLIRSQGEKIATDLLGRQVRIGEVKLHPWSLELELRDLSMAAAEPGSAPQVSIARAYVNAGAASIWRLAPVLDAIEIDQPVVRLAHLGEGKLDIDDIRARFPAQPDKPDDGKQARFALYNIAISDGRFEFENAPSGGKHVVSDLQLALPFISTLASQRQIRVTPHLSFALDGSRFDTQAHTLPFDDSRRTEASVRLAQLDLAPYLPYLPDGLPLLPTAGVLDANLRLRFDQSGAAPALGIDGDVALSGVRAKDAQGQEALAFERLDVTLLDTRPLERHIHLSQVALTKPDVLATRDKAGRINLAATGGASTKATAKPATPAASAASSAAPAASAASAAASAAAPAASSADTADTAATAASSPASSAGDAIDTAEKPASATPAASAPEAAEAAASAASTASAAPAAAPAKAQAAQKKATQTKKRRTTKKKTSAAKKKSAALLDALIPAAHAQQAADAASDAANSAANNASSAPEAPATPEVADTTTPTASSPASSAGNTIDTQPETTPAAPETAASAEEPAATAASATPEAVLDAASEPAETASAAASAAASEPASAPAPQKAAKATPAAKPAAKPASKTAAASGDAQADWTVQIDQITIDGGHVEWRDAQPTTSGTPAANVHVNGLTLAAHAFTWPLNEPMNFEGSLALSAPGVAVARAPQPQEAASAAAPAADAASAAQPAAKPAATKKATQPKRRTTKKKTTTKKKSAALFDALIPAAHAQQATDAANNAANDTASAPQTPEIADTAAHAASSPASSAGSTINTPSIAASAASEAASAASAASAPGAPASAASAADGVTDAPIAQELHTSADAATAARAAATALAASGEAWKRASGEQTLRFRGQATTSNAQVQAEASSIALALARAYIAPFLNGDVNGNASAQVNVQWSAPDALRVSADRITLDHLTLTGEGIAAPVPGQPAPSGNAARRSAQGAQGATAPGSNARDPASPLDRARTGPLVAIERLAVEGAALDLAARSVDVQRLAITAPRAAVLRHADGHLMVQDWLRGSSAAPATAAASDAASADAPAAEEAPKEKNSAGGAPWSATLKEAQVQGGVIAWRDAVPTRPVRADLNALDLKVQGIHWDGAKLAGDMPVELSAQMTAAGRRNDPGRLAWSGKVAIEPLAVQGSVNAERLPAHAFMPYAGSALNIDVLRADASFKGNVNVAQQPAGLQVAVHGDARLQELRMHSLPGSEKQRNARARAARTASQAPLAPDAAAERRASGLGEELLSFKNLRVQGVDVQMQPRRPLRIATGQTTLSDFYARLVILPDGTFSLRDIVGEGEEAPPAPQAAASAASAASAPAAPQPRDPNAPVISVGPVRVSGGRVAFTDRFIRPNYSADLSELQGSLGAFSTVPRDGEVQMAELTLTGRAQGTAALDISGRLNPLAQPIALDITGRATDLELPPLSPYTVKYAGHGIERGKLSVDVSYKVQPDGMLNATNKITLNQLEFGEPVEGAPNSLPVKLATALLADSKGVIDLDIPVSGSLNDPEFSIAPVIFKAIGNIITGIVTAPFKAIASALGGAGGGGGDPSQVHFAAGSSVLDDAARTQLDGVAKALGERAALKLTVSGTAQLEAERAGWQRQRLRDMLAAELRGDAPAEHRKDDESDSGENAAASGESAEKPAPRAQTSAEAETEAALGKLDADGYARLVRRLYRRADLPDKPRNALGMARSLPVEEMEKLLMAQIEVDDDAMRTLAQARAVAVKDYLAAKGLDSSRLFLGSSRTGAPKAAASAAQPAATPAASAASAPAIPAGHITGAVLSLATK